MSNAPARDTGGCPVDHTDYRPDRPAFWHYRALNANRERAPIMWNDSTRDGFWLIQRYEHIVEALNMPEVFSNRQVNAFDKSMELRLLPQTLDGAPHRRLRAILTPFFNPQKVRSVEERSRELAIALIEEVKPKKSMDFVKGFAVLYPTEIFLTLVGLPASDGKMLVDWVEGIFDGFFGTGPEAAAAAANGAARVGEYFDRAIAERERAPRDPHTDLITRLLQAEIDGARMPRDDVLTICTTVLTGGLDTTRSMLGYIFHHLAHDQALRHQLTVQPELVPAAIEEFVRLYSLTIQDGRQATRDIEFHGAPIREGDMINACLVQGNRDPRKFERPDEFVLNRPNIKDHLGFGSGPHRCPGSHLATAELIIAINEWHKRIPDYRIAETDQITERGGQIRLQYLPLAWD